MPGHPGTPRYGTPFDNHVNKTGADGTSELSTPVDGPFRESHFLYNPAEKARDMGSTPGDAPGKVFVHRKQQYEAVANHDGYDGGDLHLLQMDERKVLNDCIQNVNIEVAEDQFQTFSSDERAA